jgi:glycerol-3-phosphate acyltransferase PlsY
LSYAQVGIFLLAGFLGSIPFGLLVTRCLGLADPRGAGSGNIGATNVLRTSGWASGLLTLAGDIGKGAAAVGLLPMLIATLQGGFYAPEAAALGAVLGHMYSPFTGFRGGKGVATGLGVFALLMPVPTLVATTIFVAAVGITRYISLGSILAALTVPLAGGWMGHPGETTATAMLIAALIIWRHKDNIRRLLRGEENRFGSKT